MINFMVLLFIFIIGLCLGSFYNVVILRSLSGESIVFPPSKCPKCNNKLKPIHNIPVISYIMLKGRCAFCGEKISLQYPIVELATGIIFCYLVSKFGLNARAFFLMFWVSCLIIMTGTDIKEKIVDCNYAIALAVSGLIFSWMQHGFLIGIRESLFGALLGYIIIEAVAKLGELLKKGRAMGEADTFIAMALGAIVGWRYIGWVMLFSLLASMLFVLPVFWYKRYKENDVASLMFSALFIVAIALHVIYGTFFTVGFLALVGTMLAIYIIKTIHQTSNLSYLPFVPALAAGFMMFVYLY